MERKLLQKVALMEFMWWSEKNGQTTAYINIYENGEVGFEYNNYKGEDSRKVLEFKTYEELVEYERNTWGK